MKFCNFEYLVEPKKKNKSKGRPKNDAKPELVKWCITGTLHDDDTINDQEKKERVCL